MISSQITGTNDKLDILLSKGSEDLVKLFHRPDITEIYVNDDGYIWYLSSEEGKVKSNIYLDGERIMAIMRYIAGDAGKIITEDIPSISCDIQGYGYRFQGEIPPIVLHPQFNVRKKATKIFTLDDYVKNGTITPYYKEYLEKAVKSRKNILVVGGTATGKTTFLNAILEAISELTPYHRIISLEDLPELQCRADDYSPMFTVQETNEGKQIKYDMTRLLMDCMRRSPDRIVVGEVRDGCAYTMLKAWNTGHEGGCCTVHANSAEQGLSRIKALAQENADAPKNNDNGIKELIGNAIDVVVSIVHTDLGGGKRGRVVKEILEVDKFDTNKGIYLLHKIPQTLTV